MAQSKYLPLLSCAMYEREEEHIGSSDKPMHTYSFVSIVMAEHVKLSTSEKLGSVSVQRGSTWSFLLVGVSHFNVGARDD